MSNRGAREGKLEMRNLRKALLTAERERAGETLQGLRQGQEKGKGVSGCGTHDRDCQIIRGLDRGMHYGEVKVEVGRSIQMSLGED